MISPNPNAYSTTGNYSQLLSYQGVSGVTESVYPYTRRYPTVGTVTQTIGWLAPGDFQLISAGMDGRFGNAGTYSNVQNSNDPANGSPALLVPIQLNTGYLTNGISGFEFDNITSFSGGRIQGMPP